MSQQSRRGLSRRQALAIFTGVAAGSVLSSSVFGTRPAYAASGSGGTPPVPEESGIPDTDRGKVVWAYRSGRRAVRTAAAAALAGSAADITDFLVQKAPVAWAEDNRFALTESLATAGSATRNAIGAALSGGNAAVEALLQGGYQTAVDEDLRVAVSTVQAHGAKAVKRDASAALAADSPFALRAFLSDGRFTAQEEDDRVQVMTILASGSPQVREYAGRAMSDGSARAIRWFLETGQYIARARDEEAATIQQLVDVVEKEGRRASLKTDEAVELSNQAVSASEKAKASALEAKAEALAAEQDVARSAKAAGKAAQAAKGAAAAASTAVSASRTAQAAAQRSVAAANAAAARQAAAEADAAAARATQAAGRARTLAAQAAAAARAARDAANSAADHAEKAAAAAKEAAAHAGEAVDYANRSTLAANAAVEAANAAAAAVVKARDVEAAARQAEAESLAEETSEAIEQARLAAQAELNELERFNRERTQEARLTEELRALISSAESALQNGTIEQAAAAGRKAAVRLLEGSGTWTRQAAEYALAGSDQDVVNWISTDRVLALQQDNVENVAAQAAMSTQAVATAAAAALKTEDHAKIKAFLETGAVEAAAEDNRVEVARILADPSSGTRVRNDASAALDAGTAEALHTFLWVGREAAVREDDRVAASTLLANGGPYTKAAAQIALEGDTFMLRQFISTTQHEIARIDHDRATHISAVRASIARAAKIAANAQEDAARASEAAAIARQAADKAKEWANLAQGYAEAAENSAQEARDNAEAAEKSAAEAAKSAQTASNAAAAAVKASSVARQAATRAVRSAEIAARYATDAAISATVARKQALDAGKDAVAAAQAATQAYVLVAQAAVREAIQKAIDNATVPIGSGGNSLPAGAESCLTPFGKPIPSGNGNNPFELGWSWLTGGGDRSQCFGPNDGFTKLYREHPWTNEALGYFADRVRSGDYELGHTYMYDYSLAGFQGLKWLRDAGFTQPGDGLLTGYTGNSAYAFLGSQQIRMTPIRKNADGSVVWRYTAYSEQSIESATRPPVIGYQDWWKEGPGKAINGLIDWVSGDSGPGSTMTMVIEFNVTLGS
ncbi:ALF repeat-containing protein [Streptomyces hydrogenans]|uniref:ALF repeat-containing protein n=1 Tax=Streptomyces hydrogenans TaxID=1873719 RepID=UPI00362E0066